jgi:hypothetical protein
MSDFAMRQPMQTIYATPFVLISLSAFGVFIAVPRLRRHALAAVVAPAAFGFWALVGHVTWVLVCMFVLKVQLRPIQGLHGVLDVLFFFIMPGALGSWMSIWISGKVNRYIKGSAFLNRKL